MVNGSIPNSTVTVATGALLTGAGIVGATTISSGAGFAPGHSPGTITISGNLAFQSGALFLVQLDPSTASNANVITVGSATLAGTVGRRSRREAMCRAAIPSFRPRVGSTAPPSTP